MYGDCEVVDRSEVRGPVACCDGKCPDGKRQVPGCSRCPGACMDGICLPKRVSGCTESPGACVDGLSDGKMQGEIRRSEVRFEDWYQNWRLVCDGKTRRQCQTYQNWGLLCVHEVDEKRKVQDVEWGCFENGECEVRAQEEVFVYEVDRKRKVQDP